MINTLRGLKQEFEFVIIEELFVDSSQLFNGKYAQITMDKLNEINQDPFCCLDNLIINDVSMIAHELKLLPRTLILTSCNSQTKLDKLLQLQKQCENIDIAIGYRHEISTKLQNAALYTLDNLINKIEQQFTNEYKPAFIGIIEDEPSNEIERRMIESYYHISKQFNIPIISKIPMNSCILLNPQVEIIDNIEQYRKVQRVSDKSIQQLQNNNQNNIYVFSKYKDILNHYNLTNYITYKCQLKQFGGQGFQVYQNSQLLNKLQWVKEEIKIKQIIYWTCPQCKGQFDENIEKFKKMGKEFCSMKCLRQVIIQ